MLSAGSSAAPTAKVPGFTILDMNEGKAQIGVSASLTVGPKYVC
jgi:hypothetical protein